MVQPMLGGVDHLFNYSTVKEASLPAWQEQLDMRVLELKACTVALA